MHCAGIPDNDAPADTVLAVNFLGLRALTDLVLPSLADGGTIVSISSIAGHRFRDRLDEYARLLQTTSIDEGLAWLRTAPEAITGRAIYTVSKEAVWAYTMALAAQLAPRRIRVNSVAPGLVDTRLVGAFLSNMTASGKTVLQSASGGPIDPHEVTAVMRFLLSEDARRVNGQNIVVDGGFLASAEAPTWDGALSAAGAR